MKEPRSTKRGFILLITLVFMTALTVIVGSMMYVITYQTRSAGAQMEDVHLEALADAGEERAYRAIRDDYLITTATATADLRGGDTSLSVSVSSPDNMCYIDSKRAMINNNNDEGIIRTFDSNYTNTRIISVVPYVRAARQTGGAGATLQFSYTTNGVDYIILLTQVLPNSATLVDYAGSAIAGLSWDQMMSPDFRLRAVRTAGNRNMYVGGMYLRITYCIDTLKEPWATGNYETFPVSLNGGTIESVTITDEASKIHLNYASQDLLENLLNNLGVAGAATKAANIINYRGLGLTNPFDTVEELQQVTGITPDDYSAVKDYLTVYSFINSNVYRPSGPRAPVNINTASFEVLKSVFDSLNLGAGDPATLANGIISFRNSTPFVGFYASASDVDNTYFYNFVRNAAYLSTSGNPDEKDRVMDNGDPSFLIPFSGAAAFDALTTEFCYAASVFYIETLASFRGRSLRLKTLRGNDGSRVFSTYAGDTTLSGWRKENFE